MYIDTSKGCHKVEVRSNAATGRSPMFIGLLVIDKGTLGGRSSAVHDRCLTDRIILLLSYLRTYNWGFSKRVVTFVHRNRSYGIVVSEDHHCKTLNKRHVCTGYHGLQSFTVFGAYCVSTIVIGLSFMVLLFEQKLSRGPMVPAGDPFHQIEKVGRLVLRDTYD